MPSVLNSSAGRRSAGRYGLVCAVALVGALAVLVPGGVAAADTPPAGTTVVGELKQAWPEHEHTGSTEAVEPEGPQSWIETAAGESVPVATEDVAEIPLDTTVSVTVGDGTGKDGDTAPVLDSTIIAAAPPVPVVPARPVTNEVTIAMVRPAGAQPDTTTREQLVDLVDGEVAAFWSEQTNEAVRLGVTQSHDWLTTTADCSSAAALWNEVAATVGFTAGPGKHLLVYLPRTLSSCEYALGEVGRATTSGGRLYVRDTTASIIAHELGHNFGLGHSSARQCDAAVDAGSCRTAGYRDFYDVMGVSWRRLGSLNALQAAQLKVLPDAQQRAVSVSDAATSATLSPLSGTSGIRALRLTDASGIDYWLEYRTPTRRDAWLGSGDNRYRLESGVLVRRSGTFPDTSLLLDGTPAAAPGWDGDLQSALPVGVPVVLAGGQFSVVVRSVSDSGAEVQVVPTAPTTPAPAPAPVETGAGEVLPARTAEAAAPPAVAPAPSAPAEAVAPFRVQNPNGAATALDLETAAETADDRRWVFPAGVTLLGCATLLALSVVRQRSRR